MPPLAPATGTQDDLGGAVARVLVEGDLLHRHAHGVLLAQQYVCHPDERSRRATDHPRASTFRPWWRVAFHSRVMTLLPGDVLSCPECGRPGRQHGRHPPRSPG